MLEIRNPWGTMAGQYWDTTFEVGLSTLLADGDTITTDNIGTRTGLVASGSSGLSASGTLTANPDAAVARLTQALSSFAPNLEAIGTGETKFDALMQPILASSAHLFSHH